MVIFVWLRKMYDWVIRWADSPYSQIALFLIAFVEASFFPIPPDVLLIAMAIAFPLKAYRFALIGVAGSVFGGCFGYWIGANLEPFARSIVEFYNAETLVNQVGEKYEQNAFLALFIAGFTFIPYKIFTISAGFFNLSFGKFILGSFVGRMARFFAVAIIIKIMGERAKFIIDKYFNKLAVIMVILVVLGFYLVGKS